MARKALFTEALPVYETPDIRARIKRMADNHEVSQAEVVRHCIRYGIDAAEERWPSQTKVEATGLEMPRVY